MITRLRLCLATSLGPKTLRIVLLVVATAISSATGRAADAKVILWDTGTSLSGARGYSEPHRMGSRSSQSPLA